MYAHVRIQGFGIIIIFDEKDDDILLEVATRMQKIGKNPKIVEYDPDFGESVTIYDLCRMMEVPYERMET